MIELFLSDRAKAMIFNAMLEAEAKLLSEVRSGSSPECGEYENFYRGQVRALDDLLCALDLRDEYDDFVESPVYEETEDE